MTEEKKAKHLEMIESIIQRMGSNSFQLKGWSVALITALAAFAVSRGGDKNFALLALIPLTAFWFLDAFYLQLERKYRKLYDAVIAKNEEDIDFRMDLEQVNSEADCKTCYFRCLFSVTEAGFYLPLAAVMLFIWFYVC